MGPEPWGPRERQGPKEIKVCFGEGEDTWKAQQWGRGPESGLLDLGDHLRPSLVLSLALGILVQWPMAETGSSQSDKIQEGFSGPF